MRAAGHVGLLLGIAASLVAGQEETQTGSAASDGALVAPRPTLALTLEDAVRIAIQNNLDIAIEEETAEVQRYNHLASWGDFDPVFNFSGSYSDREFEGSTQLAGADVVDVNDVNWSSSLLVPFETGGSFSLEYRRATQETNSLFANFPEATTDNVTAVFTQPLLRGAWDRYATIDQRAARLTFEQARERQRQVRQDVLRSVIDAYWDFVAAQQELSVQEFALDLGERELANQTRRLEVGVGTEVEVLQAETNVATQVEQRLLAETNVYAAMDALRALLFRREEGQGLDGYLEEWTLEIVPLSPLPEVELVDRDDMRQRWQQSCATAFDHRAELTQQRLAIEAADLEILRAQSGREPQLDLNLTASSQGFDPSKPEAFSDAIGFEFPAFTAQLDYSTPLGNRRGRNSVHAARASARLARLRFDQIEMNIVAEVRTAARDVVYRAEAAAAADRSVDLAQRQLAAEQRSFEEGISTLFQVLEFQRALQQALSSQAASRAGYAKAVSALRRAEGRLQAPSTP